MTKTILIHIVGPRRYFHKALQGYCEQVIWKIYNFKQWYMMKLDFSKSVDGTIPAIVQEFGTGKILMLAYVNESAWVKTVQTGMAHYWSRSRQKLWLKGESSGHTQKIRKILVDCDADTVIYMVEQAGGAACHKGYHSCFYRELDKDALSIIEERVFDPADVYDKQ